MRNSVIFGVLLLVPFGMAHAQIPPAERAALIQFYTDTNGPGWLDQTGWLGPIDTECSWAGVYCAGGFVDQLWLFDNGLSGPISPELEDLTQLRKLYLKGNDLNGNIPPELGNLANLDTLDLFNNNLDGSIPPSLGSMTSLVNLYLPFNNLSGEIPVELGDLPNLEYLHLYDNQLTGEIPVELGNITTMTRLYLYNNQLEGNIPVELGGLPNLEKLILHSNMLSGEIPVELANALNLQDLILHSNRLTGGIPSVLSTLPVLLQLDLSNNLLTGTIPQELGSMAQIRLIFLNHNQLVGEIPPELGNLTILRQLNLADNRLEGYIPPELGDLGTMERFYVQSNRLIGQIPVEIGDTGLFNNDGMDLRWNALYNTDSDLEIFLDSKQIGNEFYKESQTTAPTDLRVLRKGDHTVELGWNAVTFLGSYEGGFEAFYVPTSGGAWTSAGRTSAKDVLAMPVTGLDPNVSYDFRVSTYTKPHAENTNEVLSEPGDIETDTTTDTGCAAPVISLTWAATDAILTVDQTGAWEWSTGETTQSITVNPDGPEYFWVWVTNGACTEADIILVETALFADDFESGDVSAWTTTSP